MAKDINISIEDLGQGCGIFIAVSELNELRRALAEQMLDKLTDKGQKESFQHKESYNDRADAQKGEEIRTYDEYKKIPDKVLLKELYLSINKGDLVTVLGETGSGKTCLINSILRNLELINENSPDKTYYMFSRTSNSKSLYMYRKKLCW